MKVKNLRTEFTNGNNLIFFSGQPVSGNVCFTVTENIEIQGVILKFKGKSQVKWTEGSGEDETTYKAKEKYFSSELNLCGANRKHGDCPNMTLHAGEYQYPFEFNLPEILPSSFEVKHGYVRYLVKVKIDRPSWHKDYKMNIPFSVISHLDLNFEEQAMTPSQIAESKMVCCLCCATGPISGVFRIERQGYVPGESIQIFGEIQNQSDRTILKTKVKLYVMTILIAGKNRKRMIQDIAKIERPQISAGGSDRWSGESLLIPPCPHSFLRGCSIIDVQYFLELTADIEDTPFDLTLQLPVIIGTIPLRTVYNMTQYGGFAPPITAAQGHPPSIDTKDISLQPMGDHIIASPPQPVTTQPGTLPSAPPPSYEESMFSGNYTNMNEDGAQENQFKPIYTYYNFNTQAQ